MNLLQSKLGNPQKTTWETLQTQHRIPVRTITGIFLFFCVISCTCAGEIPTIVLPKAPLPQTFVTPEGKSHTINIQPNNDRDADIASLQTSLKRETTLKEMALKELALTKRRLEDLQENSYSKAEVNQQRDHLLKLLQEYHSTQEAEIQALKNRILQLSKTETPFVNLSPKQKRPSTQKSSKVEDTSKQ
jgi:hypothetical protein